MALTAPLQEAGQFLIDRIPDHLPKLVLHGPEYRIASDERDVIIEAPPPELRPALTPMATFVCGDGVDLHGLSIVGDEFLDRAMQRDLPAHHRLVGHVMFAATHRQVVQSTSLTSCEPG